MRHRAALHLFFSLVWVSVLIFGFYVRLLGVSELPREQFTEADAYLYYTHAREISVSGRLPARDMRRWLPEGRDLRQSLSLYAYAVAYTQKAVSVFRPSVSVYSVAVYLPVVCFLIGVDSLCVFFAAWKGQVTSIAVGLLLMSLPGSIERSAAGFGDRDAWCLMLGVVSVVTYLSSVLTAHTRRRLLWCLLSGLMVFLGGLSWEGFGVFVWVILLIEVWRFLTTETEEGWGGIVVLGSLGFVGLNALGVWRSKGRGGKVRGLLMALLLLGVALFPVSVFLQVPLNSVWGAEVSRVVFFVSLLCCLFAFLRLSWQPSAPSLRRVAPYLAFAGWFVFWVALARDAKRYDFFIAPAIAFCGVVLIEGLARRVSEWLHGSVYVSDTFREQIPIRYLYRGGVCVFLLLASLWWPGGGHVGRTFEAGKQMRSATPGATDLAESFFWIREHLNPETAVVAASWDHGHFLRALAGVSTLIDPDHYRPQRISDYCRFVFCGQSDAEALQWLRRHAATHLLLTTDEIRNLAGLYSRVGSFKDDRHFSVRRLEKTDRQTLCVSDGSAPFTSIEITEMPAAGVVCFADGRRERIDTRVFQSGESSTFSGTSAVGGILVWLDAQGVFESGEYFPALGWNAFAVKRVFRQVASAAFDPIPVPFAGITLFEIRYDTAETETEALGK